jgi:putative DNA primase/helicase
MQTVSPDFDAARQFLAALGKPKGSIRLRGFYAKGDPRKDDDKGAKGDPTKALVESWVADRRGVYVVVNNGGDKDADITECIALFLEWDDKPKDWQLTAWQDLGLPEPTIQVDTGGKSIHSYWVLAEPIATDSWRQLQTRLLDYADADRTLKNPSRVMRLPGTPHPQTGQLAQVIHLGDTRVTAAAFDSLLPQPEQVKKQAAARKFIDYETQGLDEIHRALQAIPPRVPGSNTYPIYRNILWGLIKAVEEAGGSADTAISMMSGHSPQWRGLEQVAHSGGGDITAGTFWYWAKEHGYQAPRRIRQGPPELRNLPPNLPPTSGRQPEPGPVEIPDEEPDLCSFDADPGPADSLPFRPLGFDHGIYYYLPKAACQVVPLTAAQHNKSHFLQLAPLEWWVGGFGDNKGRVDWDSAQNAIMGACVAQGVYDPSRLRGRGAWADADRVILHLGNRLVINGRSHPITRLPSNFQSLYCYENAKAIDGPGRDTLSDQVALDVRCIAERFRWEAPASANLLLGWIVLAPVCGALKWRPHIWITGGAGTGKTTILGSFMKPLLGGMFEGATGGTTEAGLRGQLRSDAIPVVFDELEQNELKDKLQVQNILALARIASSEGGKIYKGTTNGGSNAFEIRSMFCVSSINVALIQRADLDRFCVLALRKDHMDKSDWAEFEQQIIKTCTEENGRRLVARTIHQIPTVRRNARTLAAALSRRFGQRFGDQYGTLLAGAWTLEAGGGGELDLRTATQWTDSMDWESREVDNTDADEMKCLNHILQAMVPVDGGRRVTLLELVQLASRGVLFTSSGSTDEVATILGRYGLKVTAGDLAVSNNSTALQALLRDTPWAGNAYRQALRRVPGASVSGTTLRFPASGVARATLVPLETVETRETG